MIIVQGGGNFLVQYVLNNRIQDEGARQGKIYLTQQQQKGHKFNFQNRLKKKKSMSIKNAKEAIK